MKQNRKMLLKTLLLACGLALAGCSSQNTQTDNSPKDTSEPLDEQTECQQALSAFYDLLSKKNLRIDMTSEDPSGTQTTGVAFYQFGDGLERWVTIQNDEPDLAVLWQNGEKTQDMAILEKKGDAWEISTAMNGLSLQEGNALAIVRQMNAIESNQDDFEFTDQEEDGTRILQARKKDTAEGEEIYSFTLQDGNLRSVTKTEDQDGKIVNTYLFSEPEEPGFDVTEFDAVMKAVHDSGKAVTGQTFPFTIRETD